MLTDVYPVGDFRPLPLPTSVAVCATILYLSLSERERDRVVVGGESAHRASRVPLDDFEEWEVEDAVRELALVARHGWPGYVDALLCARRRRIWSAVRCAACILLVVGCVWNQVA